MRTALLPLAALLFVPAMSLAATVEPPRSEKLGTVPEGRATSLYSRSRSNALVVFGDAYSSVNLLEDPERPLSSTSGTSEAHVEGKPPRVVWNGEAGPTHPGISCVVLSPDGSRLAYAVFDRAAKEPASFVVVDGKEGKRYSHVTAPVFSPDGRRVAYAAQVAEQDGANDPWALVVDGVEKGRYGAIGQIAFRPDSKELAFAGNHGGAPDRLGEWRVVAEGQEEPFTGVIGGLVWSADGRRLAYSVQTKGLYEQKGKTAQGRPILGKAEGRQGYVVVRDAKKPGAAGLRWDAAGPEIAYSGCGDSWRGGTVFSADGKRLAYRAKTRESEFVVLDGKALSSWDTVDGLAFSPDGKLFAYIGGRAGRKHVVIGERAGPAYDEVWPPFWTTDGQRVVYGVRRGRELWRVVDGTGEAAKLPPEDLGATPPANAGLVGDWFGCVDKPCAVLDDDGFRFRADGTWVKLDSSLGPRGERESYCEEYTSGKYSYDGSLLVLTTGEGVHDRSAVKVAGDQATFGRPGAPNLRRVSLASIPFRGPCR